MKRIQRIIVSVLVRQDNGLLLLKRARPFSEFRTNGERSLAGMALWELPGGAPDFGEMLIETAKRETLEEASVQLLSEHLQLIDCFSYVLVDKDIESHRIHVVYEGLVPRDCPIRTSDEHVAYMWLCDKNQLRDLSMLDETRSFILRHFDSRLI
jgi:8-oxo-dGTP pyrophosphatase MutT (NUDIX family)